MAGDRFDAEQLDGDLTRHQDTAGRMVMSLVELERHPGHQLLSLSSPGGRTAERWATAQSTLAQLWHDFGIYRSTVEAARRIRNRRARIRDRDLAKLHGLLRSPSVEVARMDVARPDRGLTGTPPRIETITLDELGSRMGTAFADVTDLVTACHGVHLAFVAALKPLAERLGEARRLIAELGIGRADPLVVAVVAHTARVSELEGRVATDPLSLGGVPAGDLLRGLDSKIAEVSRRLAECRAVRGRWAADLAGIARAVAAVEKQRSEVEQVRRRAVEVVAGPLPAPPADQLPQLRASLAGLERVPGWSERAAALDALQRATADVTAELRAAGELAAGPLELREELRGRFRSYRARAVRLGRAEEPELLGLDARIEQLLGTKPCDLAEVTRILDCYRLALAGQASGRTA